jgi:hypothetical protein
MLVLSPILDLRNGNAAPELENFTAVLETDSVEQFT